MKCFRVFNSWILAALLFLQASTSAHAYPSFGWFAAGVAGAYLGRFAPCDVAQLCFGWDIGRSQTNRTKACYDWFEHYLKKDYDKDGVRDYSEGLFDFENVAMTLEEATQRKYDYIYDKLELRRGMTLLDAGCGSGVWMEYLKKRGVHAVGLTLSEEQAKVVRKKGLEVYVRDYRKLHQDFIQKFDRITALGSSEHVCSSLGALKKDTAVARCNQARIDTWRLFQRYLKPFGKFYVTVLTVNKNSKFTFRDWMQAYILDRHYGGYYSSMDDIAEKIVPYTGFELTDLQNKTRDYHWSSIVDPDHFGNWRINWREDTYDKISYLLKGVVTDPYLLHHWLYYLMNTWMWQFEGSRTRNQGEPLTDTEIEMAPVNLWYFMLEPKGASKL